MSSNPSIQSLTPSLQAKAKEWATEQKRQLQAQLDDVLASADRLRADLSSLRVFLGEEDATRPAPTEGAERWDDDWGWPPKVNYVLEKQAVLPVKGLVGGGEVTDAILRQQGLDYPKDSKEYGKMLGRIAPVVSVMARNGEILRLREITRKTRIHYFHLATFADEAAKAAYAANEGLEEVPLDSRGESRLEEVTKESPPVTAGGEAESETNGETPLIDAKSGEADLISQPQTLGLWEVGNGGTVPQP